MPVHLTEDTITAIASPPGRSPLGIVRLSGPDAFTIASQVTRSVAGGAITIPLKRSTLDACVALQAPSSLPEAGELLAPAILLLMPAPRSYTAEDVVEFVCPGSPPLLNNLVASLCAAGARPADAGEFTLRAFLNGRIDLAQAEAVERIVTASTEAERRGALDCLAGELSQRIRDWQSTVLHHAATVEATLDFEEEELEPGVGDDLADSLRHIEADCTALAESARTERGSNTGILVRLCGRTNAGKSSLFNALAGDAVALVSDEPSTTRDRLRREIVIRDIQFILEDAPGVDPEAEGVARDAEAHAAGRLAEADLVLFVVDSSRPDALPVPLPPLPAERTLAVLTQCDRPCALDAEALIEALPVGSPPILRTSAVTGEGIDAMRQTLATYALGVLAHEPSVGIGLREAAELSAAARHCRAAHELVEQNVGSELVAEELRAARNAFGRSLGECYGEDILSSIFSRFCIGK